MRVCQSYRIEAVQARTCYQLQQEHSDAQMCQKLWFASEQTSWMSPSQTNDCSLGDRRLSSVGSTSTGLQSRASKPDGSFNTIVTISPRGTCTARAHKVTADIPHTTQRHTSRRTEPPIIPLAKQKRCWLAHRQPDGPYKQLHVTLLHTT